MAEAFRKKFGKRLSEEFFNFDEMSADKNIRIIVEKLKSNPDKLLMISRVITLF